jgi:hypothetical protein
MVGEITRTVRRLLGVGRVAGKVVTTVATGTAVATSWGLQRATGIERHVSRTQALNAEVAEVIADLESTVTRQDAEIARLAEQVQTLMAGTPQGGATTGTSR